MFSCKGCERRYIGCHDACEKYKAEKAAHEAQKETKRIKDGLDYYTFKQVQRNRDTRGRKWGTKDKKD